MTQNGVDAAIAAAKTYVDAKGTYSHVFSIGQYLYQDDPDTESTLQVGMVCTIEEMPGDPEKYYSYLKSSDKDTSDAEYLVAYYYSTAGSLAEANSSNTRRVTSHSLVDNADPFRIMWSCTVEIPNVINALYFQKTDIAGNLIDNAVFALYPATAGTDGTAYFVSDQGAWILLDPDTDGDGSPNSGSARVYTPGASSTYKAATYTIGTDYISSEDMGVDGGLAAGGGYITDGSGVITVTCTDGSNTYTITPAANSRSEKLVGYTHDICTTVSEEGTGHFRYISQKTSNGKYILKEILAPAGYELNPANVLIDVNDDGVYANAGTVEDGVMVGNGVGYLVKTLDTFASAGQIDDTLCWVYGLLQIDRSPGFTSGGFSWDGKAAVDDIADDGVRYITSGRTLTDNLDPYEATEAMVAYYWYFGKTAQEASEHQIFDYSYYDRSVAQIVVAGAGNAQRLWTQTGWSDLAIYQDHTYGSEATKVYGTLSQYQDLTRYGDISNLFSSSTFVRVTDYSKIQLKVVKTAADTENTPLSGAQFVLYALDASENIIGYYLDSSKQFVNPADRDETDFILMSNENGLVLNLYIPAGTYILKEIQAPDGYNPLAHAIKLTVSVNPDGSPNISAVRSDDSAEQELTSIMDMNGETTLGYSLQIENSLTYRLPETGGTGIVLYEAGGLAAVMSTGCVWLIQRRKRKR